MATGIGRVTNQNAARAYHEAGHVVMANWVGYHVTEVAIERDRRFGDTPAGGIGYIVSGGRTTVDRGSVPFDPELEYRFLEGGRGAQLLATGSDTSPEGMSDALEVDAKRKLLELIWSGDPEAQARGRDRLAVETQAALLEDWETVEGVAAELVEKVSLDGDQLRPILDRSKKGQA